jgi:hypothetical protein
MRSDECERTGIVSSDPPPGGEIPALPKSPDPTLSWADLLLVTNASGRIVAAHGDWHARAGVEAERLAGRPSRPHVTSSDCR